MKSRASMKNIKLPEAPEPTRATFHKNHIDGYGKFIKVIPSVYNPKPAPIPKPRPKSKTKPKTKTRPLSVDTHYHKRQPWTEERIEKLITLYNTGLSFAEISQQMDTSETNASMMIYKLRKAGRVTASRSTRGWTEEQDRRLIEAYERGDSYVCISQIVGKAPSAVSMRIQRLHDSGRLEFRRDKRCKKQ